MDLKTYIADIGARRELAQKLGSDPGYLWQIATGWRGRKASSALALAIENATDGVVPKESLRPDIWRVSPPALADEGAQ